MSYLNVPRIHFAGNFRADPSTINNNDANYDPTVQYTEVPPKPSDPNNTSVYWNPYGTHSWGLANCAVRSAVDSSGQLVTSPEYEPLIGAQIFSAGEYPAKIVDLDPDNQQVSQIWGLKFQISVPDPNDSTKVLASVTGTLPPTAFADLWNRVTNASQPSMNTMSASFQNVLTDVKWVNANESPILSQLQQLSPDYLSIRFNVDSYQYDSNQSNFTFGRIVGTVGPSSATEAPRSTPRRLAPPVPTTLPPFFTNYGAVGCVFDENRSVLILDLGNCLPSDGTPPSTGPTVPVEGWPIPATQLTLSFGETGLGVGLKAGVSAMSPIQFKISFDTSTYLTQAGIVEVAIPAADVSQLQSGPLTIQLSSNLQLVVQEDSEGRYVDVDLPFLRLDPAEVGNVTLWATKFGIPWEGASLDFAQQAFTANGTQWEVGQPTQALTLTSSPALTGADGTAVISLIAGDPGTKRIYLDGQPGPDGQVYQVSGSWASWGGIFLFAGAPINLLIFSSYDQPAQPTWTKDVFPIFNRYARMYPYMKGIIDLADYTSVTENSEAIQYVLNLPRTDAHHMPIVRELSADKLAMINQWFSNGLPQD